jgi:hypothetical protein
MIYNVDETSLKMTINTNKATSTYIANKNTLKEEISIFFFYKMWDRECRLHKKFQN